ncbi:oxygen-independent coproporphyrinogen-3 oxidase [Nonlabens xylanidelens]|uniref:Heme chaperone HemW n=1 Tax=Nonlabens xylanidelens TaxID=191564 RepID=A0A2S6IR69_9FLAO|nr:radical SAM family heme chaperone HemW [Nonlabens xylanidelens]PPK96753.1 oxygen-independent coproporphyrinogen-3 oxidase [Nonlabens xylanidelens]PQJ13461.1 coproporphyrinogen III oxidase [Nonlabens xylanidelens]
MSGIYIHIPFCKQACHYCDFHFSTNLKYKKDIIDAICDELRFRESEFKNTTVQTIYLGGGTPSVLEVAEVEKIIQTVFDVYTVSSNPEITLEANPDDLTKEKIVAFSNTRINRLSIGVQSFFEEDLKLMNRAHNAVEAHECIEFAVPYFPNISIDLIYGIPGMSEARWRENLHKAIDLKVPHISSYALTVEDNTALKSFIEKGMIENVDDEVAQEHFQILLDVMQLHGFENYEFSNFSKPGFFSQNNTAYWTGKSYIGIGPSAHSFDGKKRGWNINNNVKYLKAIQAGELPMEIEELTVVDRYNEYIMTGLRTIYGVSLHKIETDFGPNFKEYLLKQAAEYLKDHLLYIDGDTLLVTRKGKFLSDGIASALFMVNLS